MAATEEKTEEPLTGPFTVLITGANRGIGIEFVKQYIEIESPTYNVIACCRRTSEELTNLQTNNSNKLEIYENLDVTNEENIVALAETYKSKPIDILILNAGIMPDPQQDTFGSLKKTTLMRTFEVNTVGPILIAQSLLDNVLLSKRKQFIVITSGLGTIQDNTSGGYVGYRISKVGINCAMQEFKTKYIDKETGETIKGKELHTILLEPGFVVSGLTSYNSKQYGAIDVNESVKGMINVIDDYKNIPNCAFWSYKNKPFGAKWDFPNGKF